jgi:hypothetical protein
VTASHWLLILTLASSSGAEIMVTNFNFLPENNFVTLPKLVLIIGLFFDSLRNMLLG